MAESSSRMVVGNSWTQGGSGSNNRAFLYSDDVMTNLGTLGGNYSAALAINNSGQIVGISHLEDDVVVHAFLYADGVMTDLGTLGGTYSWAQAINSSGQIVGEAQVASGAFHAFLFTDGAMVDLNTLIPPNSGFARLIRATGINDAGQIVGYGQIDNGDIHAFLLTPSS